MIIFLATEDIASDLGGHICWLKRPVCLPLADNLAATVRRNMMLPERVATKGLVSLRGSDFGEPEPNSVLLNGSFSRPPS